MDTIPFNVGDIITLNVGKINHNGVTSKMIRDNIHKKFNKIKVELSNKKFYVESIQKSITLNILLESVIIIDINIKKLKNYLQKEL